ITLAPFRRDNGLSRAKLGIGCFGRSLREDDAKLIEGDWSRKLVRADPAPRFRTIQGWPKGPAGPSKKSPDGHVAITRPRGVARWLMVVEGGRSNTRPMLPRI